MKNRAVRFLALLAILAGGLYLAYHYKDQAGESARTSYQGAGARSAIQAWLDVQLPPSASDVYCAVEDVGRTKLVFARFDVPSIELPSLLGDRPRFPALAELKADPAVVSAMAALNDPKRGAWWQVDQLKGPVAAAQASGQRNVAPATLKWRVQICTAPAGPFTRVYIAFSEEPFVEK